MPVKFRYVVIIENGLLKGYIKIFVFSNLSNVLRRLRLLKEIYNIKSAIAYSSLHRYINKQGYYIVNANDKINNKPVSIKIYCTAENAFSSIDYYY